MIYKIISRSMLLLLLTGSFMPIVHAQTASFNFSATAQSVTGWTNVVGDPSTGTRTATHAGITVTSIGNWTPNASGVSAANGSGKAPGVIFPPQVMSNNWIQFNGTSHNLGLYNSLAPQIQISGLNKDSTYILRMSGSEAHINSLTQYTVAGIITYNSQTLQALSNLTQGITFDQITPDSNGIIRVFVNATPTSDQGVICGLQVFPGTDSIGTPAVTITTPANGTILAEDLNVNIHATASEIGGTIAKVEFFADTIKIGEVDTVPYNFTWVDPNPGSYTITVKATDNLGTINTASANIAIESLNDFWSTTGNSGTKADSNFIGTVDSVRLDFRTKNLDRMSISATGNVGIGTTTPAAQLHTTGSVRLAGLKNDSTSADPRILVSDTSGNLAYRTGGSMVSLTIGDGLGQSASGAISIGDSIPGPGPHSFMSDRYEYLNGHMYSIGGSVNDPANMPNFRIYNNGDIAAGTTMDTSVHTGNQTGLRYYSKLGVFEIGASDRLDTTQSKIVRDGLPGSGLIINSDAQNIIKGRLLNGVFIGDDNALDSGTRLENAIIVSEGAHYTSSMNHISRSIISGQSNVISAPVENSIVTGDGHAISKYSLDDNISGFENVSQDSSFASIIGGTLNQFGGQAQLVAGLELINRTPFGTTLGSGNVDFSTLSYTGMKGVNTPGIAGYPLFALGNSSLGNGSLRSNAITVLYNGRTQINTTGFSSALTQTAVTPKAALEVVSTNSGVLLPKLTTTQRNAIASGDLQNGLLLYNTDSSAFQFYNGTGWRALGIGPGVANSGWGASGNGGTNPASNFVGTIDTQRLVIRTNNIERITVLANGAVGIGTSILPASDAKLAVDGVIYSMKVRVTQTGWPDYVFDKKYRLPSLASVEEFIRIHRHLPGVISADEADQKKVDLGENQSALLKKVEELTLYLIEEHKKADDEQKEIERLKGLIRQLVEREREIDELKAMLDKLTAGKTK